jgi:hypothetical protein
MTLKEQLIKALATEAEHRLTAISIGTGRIAAAEALADHLNAAGLICNAYVFSGVGSSGGYVIAKVMVPPHIDAVTTLRRIRAAGLEVDQVLSSRDRVTHLMLKDVDVPLVIDASAKDIRAAAMALDMIVRAGADSPETLQRQAA